MKPWTQKKKCMTASICFEGFFSNLTHQYDWNYATGTTIISIHVYHKITVLEEEYIFVKWSRRIGCPEMRRIPKRLLWYTRKYLCYNGTRWAQIEIFPNWYAFFFWFMVCIFLFLNSMCLFCFARFFFFNLIRIQQSNIYFLEYLFWHDHQPEVKFPSNMMEIVFLNWIIWKLHENPKCGNVLHLILI